MKEALIAAAQQTDTTTGKIFVVGAITLLFGGVGVWSFRLAFAKHTSFGGRVVELVLALVCFCLVGATFLSKFK